MTTRLPRRPQDAGWDDERAATAKRKVDAGLYRQALWCAGAIQEPERRARAMQRIKDAEAAAGYPMQPPAASMVEEVV